MIAGEYYSHKHVLHFFSRDSAPINFGTHVELCCITSSSEVSRILLAGNTSRNDEDVGTWHSPVAEAALADAWGGCDTESSQDKRIGVGQHEDCRENFRVSQTQFHGEPLFDEQKFVVWCFVVWYEQSSLSVKGSNRVNAWH